MIQILGATPDPLDSYFFGDFPLWIGWIVCLSLILYFVLGNTKGRKFEKIRNLSLVLGLWIPLILINLDRPIILIIVTGLAFYFSKDSLAEIFKEEEPPIWFNGNFNEQGERDGYWVEWYDERKTQKKLHALYRDGKLDSCEVWTPNGDKCNLTKVWRGEGTLIFYHNDGKENRRVKVKQGVVIYD